MKPTNDELAQGVIAIGAAACSLGDLNQATIDRLAELGLAQYSANEWELTGAGRKLLARLIDGQSPEIE